MNISEQNIMIKSRKLILKGKRWRRFHEFKIFITIISSVFVFISLQNSIEHGLLNSELLPFIIGPTLFVFFWIPYKNSELKLKEHKTGLSKTESHELLTLALKKLGYTIKKKNAGYIEACGQPGIGLTWGQDYIFAVVDSNSIYLTSLCNIDGWSHQAFFTFGKLKRNVIELLEQIDIEKQSTTKED